MADNKKKPSVEDLSHFGQLAIKTKKVMGRRKFKEWQDLFAELAAFDETTDKLYDRATSIMAVFIVLAVLGFFGLFGAYALTETMDDPVRFAIMALAVLFEILFIVVAIIFGMKASALKDIDIMNDFRKLLMPFMAELAEDVNPKSRVRMQLNLSGICDEKQVEKHTIPPGRFKKVTETIYQDPWCNVSMQLEDGSTIMLNVENTVVSHLREWRNPRGKHKTKTKYKKLAVVSATVIPPGEGMDFDDEKVELLAQHQKIKMKEKEGGKVCRLVRKWKFKAVNEEPGETVDPSQVVGMFMQLYGSMKPAGKQ